MALKSLIVITYEVLTERSMRCHRWASTKANAILNCLEPVFWLAAFVLSIMSIKSRCSGGSCACGALYVVVAFVLM